jgi:hypothetical protein
MSHEPDRLYLEVPGYPGLVLTAGTYDDLIATGEQLTRLARQAKATRAQQASVRLSHPAGGAA